MFQNIVSHNICINKFLNKSPVYLGFAFLATLTASNKQFSFLQISAEKAAEKKFKSTLRSAGIDEEFLQSQNIHVSTGKDREWSTDKKETNRSFAKVIEEQAAV